VDVDQLYVKQAIANDGPRMKRIRPAPMGRAFRYVRRISHIELVLAERNRNGKPVATVVGEEKAARSVIKGKRRAAPKAKGKKKATAAR
jgi:large subunit ribosomal protein L22